MKPPGPIAKSFAPSPSQHEKASPLHLGMASIVRYKSPQTGSPSSYVVTFAVKGREVVTLSTYINSPSALLDFITQTLHLGREVAEETLTKLEREGIATIDGKK